MAKRAKKTTVFLIVDDGDQRESLATDLRTAGYDVHDYMTAREFLIDQRNHTGGVIVADYRLQGMTGLELCEQLGKERSAFPVVLLAGHTDVPKVLAAGVAELIVRPVVMESLTAAITRATEGEVFTDHELQLAFKRVTDREKEVIALVAVGKASREIGYALGISPKTIEAHRARIMDKTRAEDVGELVRLWRAWNQLETQEGGRDGKR